MFAGMARSLTPRGEHLKKVSTGLTRKNWTKLERFAKDKHSSLLGTFAITVVKVS